MEIRIAAWKCSKRLRQRKLWPVSTLHSKRWFDTPKNTILQNPGWEPELQRKVFQEASSKKIMTGVKAQFEKMIWHTKYTILLTYFIICIRTHWLFTMHHRYHLTIKIVTRFVMIVWSFTNDRLLISFWPFHCYLNTNQSRWYINIRYVYLQIPAN